MTAQRASLTALVRQAYPTPEWAVFLEVSNATGFRARRRADAVALGVWPSRGHALVGFEFKEDRHDWLNEKKNPEKAEAVATHCDCWYVVAGRKGIVLVEELPAPWGLYVANDDRTKLMRVKEPAQFPDRDHETIRRSFAASMLRKVSETTMPLSEVEARVQKAVQDAQERTREGQEQKYLQRTIDAQREALDAFKAATGVDLLHGWQGPRRIAAAVHAVLDMDSHRRALEDTQKRLAMAGADIEKALKAWPRLALPEAADE